MESSKNYRRHEASSYLKEKWGIDRKTSTLAKLAVQGGGPRFAKAGRFPLYPEHELDMWARSIISPLQTSTSSSQVEEASHD